MWPYVIIAALIALVPFASFVLLGLEVVMVYPLRPHHSHRFHLPPTLPGLADGQEFRTDLNP